LNKKILIIGGTGFIGYHLSKKCIQKGWNVTSISTHKPKKIRFISKVKYVICDITKKKKLEKKLSKNFNFVVNLGGYVDHSDRKKTFKSHFLGVKNLASIFLNKSIQSFVQIGSGGEYGKSKSPHKEIHKGKPISVYYKAKLLATTHLLKLNKTKKFPVSIIRLYQAYGPRQDFNRFIPIIIQSCLKNKRFPCSEGKQFRDFIFVDDVVDAIIKSLKSSKASGQIFNIGSGKPFKIKDIIKKINKKIKKGYPLYGKIKLRKDEEIKTFPSIAKAKKLINWRPKVSFQHGLQKTINFYNSRK
tara:strand:+ start:3988 stop:4890 length:903 start_codon:yes stop_codon:yes gene_type:complete